MNKDNLITIFLLIIAEIMLLIVFIFNQVEFAKNSFLVANLDGMAVIFVIGISIVINMIRMGKKSFPVKFCPHWGSEIKEKESGQSQNIRVCLIKIKTYR